MGKAVIVSGGTAGQYQVKRLHDFRQLDGEVARIEAEEAKYFLWVLEAFKQIDLLRDDKAVAAEAMNAVIAQWQAELIAKLDDAPPPLEPPVQIDPETGEPWTDQEKAQREALWDAVNAARVSAGQAELSRDAALDEAAHILLRYQSVTRSVGHFGANASTPEQRVRFAGYLADEVGELVAYGQTGAAAVIAAWNRNAANRATLTGADWIDGGVAYRYAPGNPSTHLWCAVVATPGTPPVAVELTPVQEEVEEVDSVLDKITIPGDEATPKRLGETAGIFAKAAMKLRAAEDRLAQLYTDKIARGQRLAELAALRTELADTVLSVWSAEYNEVLSVGETVLTLEPPGDLSTVLNIAPYGVAGLIAPADVGQWRPTAPQSPEAVFYNAAMEPGHLKWKPFCRHGTITALAGDLCSVTLMPALARQERGNNEALNLNTETALTNVPIRYMWCNGAAFEVGDEVLVLFEGRDRLRPKVIGFKSNPRSCEGRISWEEF